MLLGMNLGMTLHFVVPIERFGAAALGAGKVGAIRR
jgi:hypothetical protein